MDEVPPNNAFEFILHLPLFVQCEHLAGSFIQESCLACGLPQEFAVSMAEAVRQIFTHLAQTGLQGHPLKLICRADSSFARAEMILPGRESATRGHARLPASTHQTSYPYPSPFPPSDTHSLLEHIALAIALGQLDHFSTTLEKTDQTRLILLKEKNDPLSSSATLLALNGPKNSTRLALPHEIPLLIQRIRQKYNPQYLPADFNEPEQLANRVRRAEYHALLRFGEYGEVCAAVFWQSAQHKTISCSGPYVLVDSGCSAHILLDDLLHTLAKQHIVSLLNGCHPPDFPTHLWEKAGSMVMQTAAPQPLESDFYFRMMIEDQGSLVWAHPALHSFLCDIYHRLALPRECSIPPPQIISGDAVLSIEYERSQNRVILRPLSAGASDRQILSEHVSLLRKYGIQIILFEMDLAHPMQSSYAPALLETGFIPRLVLPHAGEGDLLLFQYAPMADSQTHLSDSSQASAS